MYCVFFGLYLCMLTCYQNDDHQWVIRRNLMRITHSQWHSQFPHTLSRYNHSIYPQSCLLQYIFEEGVNIWFTDTHISRIEKIKPSDILLYQLMLKLNVLFTLYRMEQVKQTGGDRPWNIRGLHQIWPGANGPNSTLIWSEYTGRLGCWNYCFTTSVGRRNSIL